VRREVVLDVGAANPKRMDVILQMGDLTYFIDVGVTNPACVTNLELANHPAATIGANTSGTVEARAALLQLAEARQPVSDIAAMAMETGNRSENGTVILHLVMVFQTSFVPFIIESMPSSMKSSLNQGAPTVSPSFYLPSLLAVPYTHP
jgi:hypothetical protein